MNNFVKSSLNLFHSYCYRVTTNPRIETSLMRNLKGNFTSKVGFKEHFIAFIKSLLKFPMKIYLNLKRKLIHRLYLSYALRIHESENFQ